jgi:DNA-binding transcriptional regulator YiaG
VRRASVNASSRPYQYAECGLDYVYLVGGFEIRATPHGDQLTIINQKGLHRAIGKFLVTRKKELTGKEIRFLRHEMDMSQPVLARLLGVTEQTVQKWESGKTTQVPAPASGLIRVLYSEHTKERSGIRRTLKKIADLENEIDDLVTFICEQQARPSQKLVAPSKQHWRETKAKAA